MTDRERDTPELDVDFARAHFPALADGWAFFENAGGSYVPRSVIERVTAYMTETQVQPGASYAPSAAAAERMVEGRQVIAQMINADADEMTVGPSTTANVYMLSHAIRPWFQPGDEVVVTDLDHEANNGAWRRLTEIGAVVKEWRMDPATAELDPAALEPLLGPRTRLVCAAHCSNITGAINDVAAIAQMVHAAGGLLFVDGVAFAPHRAIDVRALDVDFYAFSPYKVYGPHLGALFGKREHLIAAEGQNHYFFRADDVPDKIAPGYPNHELTAGLAGIADYFDQIHAHHFAAGANTFHERAADVFRLFAAHEERLAVRFADFLASDSRFRLIGRATGSAVARAPTFSFTVQGMKSAALPPRLEAAKVAIRNGDFYAIRLMGALGLDPSDGVVRASMVHYNSAEDVDRLIDGLEKALG
ncbi:MAG: cysteine desulfurase-like protein [Rhodospirillales bacterium]|jgi:cysteine desulfurase family protein (TIGR01976 family)|nr:cysteine desulfurase-like protein [Rhodospirillales bacterium]